MNRYIEKQSQILYPILKSNIDQWLLNDKHKDSECELALWSSQSSSDGVTPEGNSKELIIDRTFIDKLDKFRWIIDYKSSEHETNQSIEDFIQQEAETYREQLYSYKVLAQEQAEPIRCALYFPLIDNFYGLDSN
ncbi:MAG: hypothetical protein ACJAUP_000036 [Cellvibrionaceae bacterium]